MADRELHNETDLEFTDISMEEWRRYEYRGVGEVIVNLETVIITRPQWLAVTEGGHRILDLDGFCHYIPIGWRQIVWKPRSGQPDFVR